MAPGALGVSWEREEGTSPLPSLLGKAPLSWKGGWHRCWHKEWLLEELRWGLTKLGTTFEALFPLFFRLKFLAFV